MEGMEYDSLDIKDDHNHNYCGSGGGKVRKNLSNQLSGETADPQPACPSASGGEQSTQQGTRPSGTAGRSEFVDSDTSSESSEVSDSDCTAASAGVEGKFSLDSTSKFRKFSWRKAPLSCRNLSVACRLMPFLSDLIFNPWGQI